MNQYYTNTAELKNSVTKEYVFLIDIMGTKNCMMESFERSANFILRLHSCVIDVVRRLCTDSRNHGKIRYYPIMDGIYLTSPDLSLMTEAVRKVFTNLAYVMTKQKNPMHQFLVRGVIAYGDICHGHNVSDKVCSGLAGMYSYKNNLLMGLPMIQAYSSESSAAPFGVFIHESARLVNGLQGSKFRWWSRKDTSADGLIPALASSINSYFDWCQDNYLSINMDLTKISRYRNLVSQYFSTARSTLSTSVSA